MKSAPTAARPTYRARVLRLASTPAMIVATPHASHTVCHNTLSMAASFWTRVHFDHTEGLPDRPEANVPHQVSVDPRVVSLVTGLAR
jgi:hypothetical protein